MTEQMKQSRIDDLKAMDRLMRSMNNEEAFMCWICIFPDGAIEDDYADIAEDEEQFEECVLEFLSVMRRYMKDGLCLDSEANRWGTKAYYPGMKRCGEEE